MLNPYPMLILIDNYDSFTYNLYQYLGDLGVETTVIRNDQATADDIIAMNPKGILISPSPGHPEDAGICIDMIHKCIANDTPLLGVCLGHQAIGHALGAPIIQIVPKHGKTDTIEHTGGNIFSGLNQNLQITRYHSLVIDPTNLPGQLEVTAFTPDGIIMGIRHKDHPIFGVQFHPESIATEHGHTILKNFCEML